MAMSTSYPRSLKLAVTVAFIFMMFFFTFLPPKSVGLVLSRSGRGGKEMGVLEKGDESERVVGSRPPGCENKCMSCRPCTADVVVPVHRRKAFKPFTSSRQDEDSYYLLSWKCRCGNKIYQP